MVEQPLEIETMIQVKRCSFAICELRVAREESIWSKTPSNRTHVWPTYIPVPELLLPNFGRQQHNNTTTKQPASISLLYYF